MWISSLRGAALTAFASAVVIGPAHVSAEVLFDHVDATASTPVVSQNSGDVPDESGTAYDDFTVPAGEVWHPKLLFLDGSGSGTATTAPFAYELYRGNGLPTSSNTIYPDLLLPLAGTGWPDVTLDIGTGGVLPPGDYLIQARAQLPRNPGANHWFWQANDELFGAPAVWQGGAAYATSCTLAPAPRSTVCLPGTGPDQSFRLEGKRVPAEVRVTSAKARTDGRLTLKLSVPSCCSFEVFSKQMSPTRTEPNDIGPLTVKLRPRPETLFKLEAGKKVTAKVTLRSGGLMGGADYTAKLRKKLKP